MTTHFFLATANWTSSHDWVNQSVLLASGDLQMEDAHIPWDTAELKAAHRAQSECPPITMVETIMECVLQLGMEAQIIRAARRTSLSRTDREHLKRLADTITVPDETITISQGLLDEMERNEDEIVAKGIAALQ